MKMVNSYRESQDGISLVELLIVVSILGIIAMLAYPQMMLAMEDARLNAAAGDVATAMEYARLKAVNSGLPSRVECHTSTDSIELEHFSLPHEISEDVPSLNETVVEGGTFEKMDHPFNPGVPYSLHLGGDGLFGGVDVTDAVFGTGSAVTFDGLGAPSEGGAVTLVCGGHRRVVHVDALTGKVTVTS
jgi:prepilin-type N-terminal cleavage/methylation domain-containing protein